MRTNIKFIIYEITKIWHLEKPDLLHQKVRNINQYWKRGSLIDSYYGKRWILTGSDNSYNKNDLYLLIQKMDGKRWTIKEHWDFIESDIIIDMGKKPYKLKMFNKEIRQGLYVGRQLPRIITIQEFRKDIGKMIRDLSE